MPRHRRPVAGRLGLAVAAMAAAALGHAGRADPGLTLTAIAVDGQFADWAAVLANPRQATRDGDGSSYTQAQCAQFSTDRDCSLAGGSGNDFLTFAWTYDSSAVSLYIERYGSPTNGVDLLFVADVNGDKKLDATHDRVIHAHWNGTTGVVSADWSAYVPANPAGDDVVCVPTPPATLCPNPAGVPAAPPGFVDGYKLPGSNPQVNACAGCSGRGNTAAGDPLKGLQVEVRIPWSNFGVATPQPFFWHAVGSNNGTLASAVDDIGAPDGKLGSFFYRAVSLTPDRGGSVLSPGSAIYDHVLANDGNAEDVFDLLATSSLGARLEILDGATVAAVDETGDGAWEGVAAGYDSNGNGRPDFTLAAGASRALSIRVAMPSGRRGDDVTRLTALSAADATVSATATDVSMVGAPALLPASQSRWTVAGQPVPYPLTLVNAETGADTFDFSASAGCAGWQVELLDDAAGAPGALAALDAEGDGAWDAVGGGYDSNANGQPDFGPTAAGGGRKDLWLRLTPPGGTPPGGSCSAVLTALSAATGASDAAAVAATVGPPVSFTPSYTFAAGTGKLASPGGAVFFPGVIRNHEDVARSYALSTPSLAPVDLFAPLFWTDPDGDGNPSDGALVAATQDVPPYGGELA
ncbi:MAG TPA: hypothetical protein VFI16_11515, partial [Anaeromyxobacteraceae bacterium]|nr:hypothetical protein [Anaeromyxobacteraceae bacterium]